MLKCLDEDGSNGCVNVSLQLLAHLTHQISSYHKIRIKLLKSLKTLNHTLRIHFSGWTSLGPEIKCGPKINDDAVKQSQ